MLLNVNLNTTATLSTETRPNLEAAEPKAPASVQEEVEVETDLVNEEEATVASKIKEHYILLLKVNNNGCRS